MYIKRILLIIALAGLLGGSVFVYNVYNALFAPNTNFENEEAYVYVPTNAGYQEVRSQLEPLLKDINSFDRVAERKGYMTNIKAGKYRIEKGMNNNAIINAIRSGNVPVNLTFNNQETLEDLAGRVSQQLEADSVSLVKVFSDPSFLKENGFNKATALSMYVPNSYEFFWNTGAEDFRERMLKEYKRFWNEQRMQQARAINLSPNEVSTLAAIVQKETAKVEERPRVAGVYLNRLRLGMPLQADPTVIYAVKAVSGDFSQQIKRVLFKDLATDSPYNTYKYGGLPPGPITMPDISSIDAVLKAEKHNYLYFVADVNRFGYHKFAKTLAEHNQNAREYQRWIQGQGVNR